MEDFLVELNLRNKKKCLLYCSYNLKKASIINFKSALSKSSELCTAKYNHLLFLGDFNGE